MKIQSTSRSSLISFCKTWVSASLNYSFSYESLLSFFRGQLLSRQGIRTGKDKFVRFCQGLYFEVRSNGLPVLHFLETDTSGEQNTFRHVFITESTSAKQEIEIELTELGASKDWANQLIKAIPTNNQIYLNRAVRVAKSKDEFIFKSVDTASTFDMTIPSFTASICLQSGDITIPVCHVDTKVVESINLGYTLKHEDLINPVEIYSSILDLTNEFKVISPIISKSLNYILYKTNSWSKVSKVNRQLSILDFGHQFNNINEVDIFKSLLLSDNYSDINVSASKLYAYVNNLFKSPDYREGYIMSVSDDDALALKLGDIMDDENQADVLIEQEDLEQLEADEPSLSDDIDVDLDILNDDFDDIDFEGFGEEEELDPNERAFQFLDVALAETDESEKVFQSSRTGITVNPNSEFPYGIMRYLQKWRSENKLVKIRSVTTDESTALDIPQAYLTSYRLTGIISENLFHRLTRTNSIELPCVLSDLITIQRVIG